MKLDLAKIIAGTCLLVILFSGAMSACISLDVDDEFITIEQNSIHTLEYEARNGCSTTQTVSPVAEGALPAYSDPVSFVLAAGQAKPARLMISPASAEPGMYELTLSAGGATRAIALKVVESGGTVINIVELPSVVDLRDGETATVYIGVRNSGKAVLNNVVVLIEGPGRSPVFYRQPFDIQPGKVERVSIEVEGLGKGLHHLTAKVISGPYSGARNFEAHVYGEDYEPVSVHYMIRNYEGEDKQGYVLRARIKNNEFATIEDIYVTVEDAPVDWEVIAPSPIDLAYAGQEDLEVLLFFTDSNPAANITFAIYSTDGLLKEGQIELSAERVGGPWTGLVFFGPGSFWIGAIAILLIAGGYLVYKRKKEGKEGLEAIRKLFPI